MGMCTTCQSKYDSYATLLGNLSKASEQNSTCISTTTSMQTTFKDVVINKFTIDHKFSGNILVDLNQIGNNLSYMITECENYMNLIDLLCPGEDHYKEKTSSGKKDKK